MISTKKRIQCFIFALVFALAFSYNCYMDSINNKVYATSEAISYTAWELFQSLMITLGFSVTSTTSAAPTVDQILDEFLGDTYEMWARENLSDEAMESNKQFLRDFLETEYEASAYATQEIMSWLPSYVNSEQFLQVIENQSHRDVVYDDYNDLCCDFSLIYDTGTDSYNPTAKYKIVSYTANVHKVFRVTTTVDNLSYRCDSLLVSSEPFIFLDSRGYRGYAKSYVCDYGKVYYYGIQNGRDSVKEFSVTATGYGILIKDVVDSLDIIDSQFFNHVWVDVLAPDVIWGPTTVDVGSDVALDWVDALEGVRDVVIPYTDALEDILAKVRAGLLTWEEAMEALNIRAVDRTAEGEQEGTGEAEEVNPSKPSDEEN